MVTVLDLAYGLLIAAAFPLLDHLVLLPGYRRRATLDAVRARSWFWRGTLTALWLLTALGAALWIENGRSWTSIGFVVPTGWRAWGAIGLCGLLVLQGAFTIRKVAQSEKTRASIRKQFGAMGLLGSLVPTTDSELAWWAFISFSAGLCEEFLFRGYLIWVLMPFIGWWGAAAVSIVLFAIPHAYQGRQGVYRSGMVAVVLTATVAIFNSLIPAIVLHALIDMISGCIAWLAFRKEGRPEP